MFHAFITAFVIPLLLIGNPPASVAQEAAPEAPGKTTAGEAPEITPDVLFDWSFDSWATENGMNFEERADSRAEFDFWYKRGFRTRAEIKQAILFGTDDTEGLYDVNLATVANLPSNIELWTAIGAYTEADGLDMALIDQFMRGNPKAYDLIANGVGVYDYRVDVTVDDEPGKMPLRFPTEPLEKLGDPDNQNLLHMFDMWRMSVDRADETINRIQDTLSTNPTTGWTFPVVGGEGTYSNYFNKPHTKRDGNHMGIDVYADRGAYIVSPLSGTVVGVGSGGAGGNWIKVESNGIVYYYAHMNQRSHLQTGASVNSGTLLGYVGNSGSASGTKPHVHFEMRKDGKWVNPYNHLQAAEGAGGAPSFSGVSTVPRSGGASSTPRTTTPSSTVTRSAIT